MAKSTKMPITVENLDSDGYHIFTEVKIEGRIYRALVDTGASKTVISQELSLEFKNLERYEQEDGMAKGIGEQMLKTDMARIPKIRLGRFKMDDLIVGVMDLSHIAVTYSELGMKPFQLILGGDLLNHYQAVINYKKRFIKLHK